MCDQCDLLEQRCRSLEQAIKDSEAANEILRSERKDVERDLRVLRAVRTRLENERARELGESVEAKVVMELLEFYAMTTGHVRTKINAVGNNADVIRKAMKEGFTVEEIKGAFVGAGKFPFVVDFERSPTGTKKQRFDDIPCILKTEKQIYKLIDKGLEDVAQPVAQVEEADEVPFSVAERWRSLNFPQARVVSALWEIDAELLSPSPDQWLTDCPVHFGPGLIAKRSKDGLMSVECSRGCEFWRLLAALNLEPADLFENAEQDPARESAGPRSVPAHLQEAAGLLRARLSGLA